MSKYVGFGPLLEVAMSKKRTALWGEAHLEVKVAKHTILRPLVDIAMSKKCKPCWREAHFEVKKLEKHVNVGVCLDIAMSKKYYMPLGREAHFEVHSGHHTFEPLLDITISKKMHCVVPQSTFKRKK